MKRIIIAIATIMLGLSLASCGRQKFKILLPTEYMAPELISSFQKEYGVKVKAIPFVSNEAAITRLKMEEFDLVISSDYATEQLIEEDLIMKIDWNRVNLNPETDLVDTLVELLDQFKESDKPLDLLEYTVPYFWGNLGIIYNNKKVSLEKLEQMQWSIFTDTTLDRAVYDSSRDAFFFALKQNGFSANSEDDDELEIARAYLEDIALSSHRNGEVVYLTDEILDDMQKTTPPFDVALVYGGDALYIKHSIGDSPKNDFIDYYVPTVGTNIFLDGFVIPKNTSDVDLVYAFINHISKHENSVINTTEIGYISAIKSVYDQMIKDEDSVFYPYKELYAISYNKEVDEIYRYVPKSKLFMDEEWGKIKGKKK